ncbi:hypothetical protein SDC9_207315 [bioreactor metagenome]|uniref:Uncharacterized protein n=1 Tax=bioreactor metagenome TaxID=1076179 RepID=A0A645JGV8_9ZZZZ
MIRPVDVIVLIHVGARDPRLAEEIGHRVLLVITLPGFGIAPGYGIGVIASAAPRAVEHGTAVLEALHSHQGPCETVGIYRHAYRLHPSITGTDMRLASLRPNSNTPSMPTSGLI